MSEAMHPVMTPYAIECPQCKGDKISGSYAVCTYCRDTGYIKDPNWIDIRNDRLMNLQKHLQGIDED